MKTVIKTPIRRQILIRHSIPVLASVAWLTLSPASRAQEGDLGNGNTAEGAAALFTLQTGTYNTAIGNNALNENKAGNQNTATGASSLVHNNADNNTAVGFEALYINTSGTLNTAIGVGALEQNNIGNYNTATGCDALLNSNADDNTATGALALNSDTSGYYNTATGVSSLFKNTTGYYNVVSGVSALYYNVAGHDNAAVGFQALLNNNGSGNVALGSNAGANLTSGSNNIIIGAGVPGTSSDANVTRIGKSTQKKTFIAGIYGKTVASGVGVIINSNGQLGTVQSSARFKDDIKPMENASEAILSLKPVTFHYKNDIDPDKVPQFGLIAEQVEKVNPDLVVRDEDGKPYTVRYEAVNAMLLNEFLKEHKKVEEQEAIITQLKKEFQASATQQQKEIIALTATVKEQLSLIRKVSDQLQANRSASQLVVSNE